MTPAAVLFCTTLVTTVPHGSIAQHNCRFVEPPFTGSRTPALEMPVRKDTHASVFLPTNQVATVESVAPIAAVASVTPIAPVAPIASVRQVKAPILKPAVKYVKHYKPRMRGKVAHLTTFRRHGAVVVSPASSEITDQIDQNSFWEKLKRFDLLK
jgi:hypothetical protein